MVSPIEQRGDTDLEKGLMTAQLSQNPLAEPSPSPSPSSKASALALVLSNSPSPSSTVSTPALVFSNSGKRIDQMGKKKYVKQVTGWHNNTELQGEILISNLFQ
ncbi:hypothetical protein TB1_031236 [Malus domestica]